MKVIAAALVLVAALSNPALAGGTWSEKISYRATAATSIKVVEPEGFKVTVATAEGDKRGTVPEVFQLPATDAFVLVTIEARDGSKWSKKVEVRTKQQTEIVVGFTPATEPVKASEPAKAARKHIGRFVNRGGGCGKAWERAIKAEFRRADGDDVKATVELAPGEYKDVEIAAGGYEVRIAAKDGAAWKFILTQTADIKQDGWALGFGCKPNSQQPVLVGK